MEALDSSGALDQKAAGRVASERSFADEGTQAGPRREGKAQSGAWWVNGGSHGTGASAV